MIYILLFFFKKLQNLVHSLASELMTLLNKKQQILKSSVLIAIGGTVL